MDEQKESKYRLTPGLFITLFLTALPFDLVGLIPGLEIVLGPISMGIFYLILRKRGINILQGRKLATALVDLVIGFVPGLQALPQITLGIVLIMAMVYAEDKVGIKLSNGKGGLINKSQLVSSVLNQNGVRQPNQQPKPLNEDGVRQPPAESNVRVLGDHSRSEAANITKMEDIRPKEDRESLELAA